jgi:hypothetical protein
VPDVLTAAAWPPYRERTYTARPTHRRQRGDQEPVRSRIAEPSRQLLAAVLSTAIADLFDPRDRGDVPELRAAARAWVGGADALVTFAACCGWLDLDPDDTRRALLGRAAAAY